MLHCLLPSQKDHSLQDSAQPPQEEAYPTELSFLSAPSLTAPRGHTAACASLAVAGCSARRCIEGRACFRFFLKPSTCPGNVSGPAHFGHWKYLGEHLALSRLGLLLCEMR